MANRVRPDDRRGENAREERAKRPVASAWALSRTAGTEILRTQLLARLAWVVHGFSTRKGGQSVLDGQQVFSLGYTEWDTRGRVEANRTRFIAALAGRGGRGGRWQLAMLRQRHSDLTHEVAMASGERLRGDALISRTPGLLLGIETADCIPILLADTTHRAVAAVHAGWRGTLARIVAKALGEMQMRFGTHPADVVAALGPGIGRCCYEVGMEVVQEFASQFGRAHEWFAAPPPSGFDRTPPTFDEMAAGAEPMPLNWLSMAPPGHDPPAPRLRLDLVGANRWQLLDAGVEPANIVASELCTSCRADLFFSHRREAGRTGRMLSVIGIK